MDITWHGYSCFTIKTKQCVIVTDPYDPAVTGLKLPELKADIVMISNNHPGHDFTKGVTGEPQIIDWPGEYDIKGVAVVAKKVASAKDNQAQGMFFNIAVDGLRLCFLGDMRGVDDALIEGIGDVDILFLPVGGHNTMNAKQAHEVIEELEPRLVIPMHYAINGVKDQLDELEPFLKLIGMVSKSAKEKFTVNSRAELKEDKMDCVVLLPRLA